MQVQLCLRCRAQVNQDQFIVNRPSFQRMEGQVGGLVGGLGSSTPRSRARQLS
jgi:hypothetical protein